MGTEEQPGGRKEKEGGGAVLKRFFFCRPLLIDPQGQAHKWISNRESVNGLKTVQLAERSFRNNLEECMGYGKPLLIENVEEEIDPVLDPVFLKQIIPKGRGNFIIQLSDKECDYNEMFTLAMTTKLPNPHFTPELSAKVTVSSRAFFLRAEPRSHCRALLRLALPPSHCNAATADRAAGHLALLV